MTENDVSASRVMQPTAQSLSSEDGHQYFVVGDLAGVRSWREKIESGQGAVGDATQSTTAG